MADVRDDQQRRKDLAGVVETTRAFTGMSIAEAVRKSAANPATKISRAKWTQIEQGSKPVPSKATIVKVARVLGADAKMLLSAAGYEHGPDGFIDNDDGTTTVVEVKRVADGIDDVLAAIREQLERLADAYELLARRDPPAPTEPDTPREGIEVHAAGAARRRRRAPGISRS